MRRRSRFNKRPRSRAAFTLMEVLLVLAILVILGSLTVFAFRDTLLGAHSKTTKIQINNFEIGMKAFLSDYNHYPASLDELYQPPDKGDGSPPRRYLEKPIGVDPWGNPYQYQPPASSLEDYKIWSLGPDGQEGTGDDIGSWQ